MPLYEYVCPDRHIHQLLRERERASEPVLCPTCSQLARRHYSGGVTIQFKGPGFYTTDYARPAASADD